MYRNGIFIIMPTYSHNILIPLRIPLSISKFVFKLWNIPKRKIYEIITWKVVLIRFRGLFLEPFVIIVK